MPLLYYSPGFYNRVCRSLGLNYYIESNLLFCPLVCPEENASRPCVFVHPKHLPTAVIRYPVQPGGYSGRGNMGRESRHYHYAVHILEGEEEKGGERGGRRRRSKRRWGMREAVIDTNHTHFHVHSCARVS